MKIAIGGDSHDNLPNLDKFVDQANAEGCELLLFTGDLVAPWNGVNALAKFKGEVKFVFGNNDGDKFKLTTMFAQHEHLELCGDIYEGEIAGKKIFMNHYPRIAELAAKSGEFDLAIHGHTHEYREERSSTVSGAGGECLLINPGNICGFEPAPTFIICEISDSQVAVRKVSL